MFRKYLNYIIGKKIFGCKLRSIRNLLFVSLDNLILIVIIFIFLCFML